MVIPWATRACALEATLRRDRGALAYVLDVASTFQSKLIESAPGSFSGGVELEWSIS
jgi:hypothetical protein